MGNTITSMFLRGLKIFWGALKENWIAGIIIWACGATIVTLYYHGNSLKNIAENILVLRGEMGLLFPILTMMIFGAVLPSLTQMLISPSDRMAALKRLPLLMPFWAYRGMEVEFFYRFQAWFWGNDSGFVTVACKVFTDMFVYTPVITIEMLYLRWVSRRVGELSQSEIIAPNGWYRKFIVPMLVADWALWIPAVTLVYMMPLPLQLPLANLILWLWSMMLFFMTRQKI
jgi:hypothetical protein